MNISKDRYSLLIDGKRKLIWSGAIHYFRMPHTDQWLETLKQIKKIGMNAVDVYYSWAYHSEKENEYCFSENRNIDLFMDMIEDLGLYLIARPGPYICAEIDAGGLPAWLLSKPHPILRCRKGGKIVYDESYMSYVRQWWEQVVPKIASRKNLILFQIENEFNLLPHLQGPMKDVITFMRKYNAGLLAKIANEDLTRLFAFKLGPALSKQTTEKSEHNPYMQKLYDWSRELGITVPLFHNDILSAAQRQIDVDMMSIDDYPITDFSKDWRKKKLVFQQTDIIEEGHAAFNRDEPVFAAEFQSSWFDSWGGVGYDRIREFLGADQIDVATKSLLAQRGTVINYFMFTGGTTWGYMTSPDVYTSYDMGAPITESGEISERGEAVSWLIKEVARLGDDFLATDLDPEVTCRPNRVFCRARKSNSRHYVFLRNVGGPAAVVRLNKFKGSYTVGRAQMLLLVFDAEGALIDKIEPFLNSKTAKKGKITPPLPSLDNWTFCNVSPQIEAGFDASGWKPLDGYEKWDIDSLGLHYGYVWYRGVFKGRISKLFIDARHCLSVYVNGNPVASRDNFRNYSGVGDDVPETFEIDIPSETQHAGTNTIAILVESLGHNKDFENDARNPRGIVSIKSSGAKIVWRFRGGLLDGEAGLTPVLGPEVFAAYSPKEQVALPHFWEPGTEGVGLYETTFELDIPDENPAPVGLVIPEAFSKANIYVNGYLMGRYWHEKGPQKKFYMPWGVLRKKGVNHIAVAVWKRWEAGGLGKVEIETC